MNVTSVVWSFLLNRGKCSVALLNETESVLSYLDKEVNHSPFLPITSCEALTWTFFPFVPECYCIIPERRQRLECFWAIALFWLKAELAKVVALCHLPARGFSKLHAAQGADEGVPL